MLECQIDQFDQFDISLQPNLAVDFMKHRILTTFLIFLLSLWTGCSDSSQQPGNAAIIPNDFLSGGKYTSLVIEIVSVSGFAPSASAIDNMKAFLSGLLNKNGGITVVQSTITSPGKSAFTLEDVKAIEAANRKQVTSGTTLTAFFFFADGDYAGNSGGVKVFGFAYGGSSMALFEKTVYEFSGGVGKPAVSTLETAVMKHEFGHILGLVNNGTALQSAHQDSANGKHCNEQNCLMYFNVETSDIGGNLLGGVVPELDANCLADLKANGGK